ncbi:MAG: DUF3368 domain-containing protein [Candidatus Riflebacteria bacterium]|nr:DUF3368 domain-containing protein [Candidatus Riflebacteria bacterium]
MLAKQVRAPLLLMDERLGRRTAARLNLAVIGTAGILVLAKRRGLVEAVRPLLESLRSHHGFRLSGTLAQEILQSVDELP